MTMRFYTLLLTILFILINQLNADTFESGILTPEENAQIEAKGIEGAQSVIADLDASKYLSDSDAVKKVVREIADLLATNDSSNAAIIDVSQTVSESILLLSNSVSIDLNADGASDSTDISLLIGAVAEGATVGIIHRFVEVNGDVNGDGRIDYKDIPLEITETILKGFTQTIRTVKPRLTVTSPNTLLTYAAEQGIEKGYKDIIHHLKTHNDYSSVLVHPRVETLNEDPTIVSPIR